MKKNMTQCDISHIGSKSDQTESNYVFKALQQSLIHGFVQKSKKPGNLKNKQSCTHTHTHI